MLTTIQVRAIMRRHIKTNAWDRIWTNRWKNSGDVRSVKCYEPSDFKQSMTLLRELQRLAGANNVNITAGSEYLSHSGITVRCLIAK